jgi:hypothetical protein
MRFVHDCHAMKLSQLLLFYSVRRFRNILGFRVAENVAAYKAKISGKL